MLRLNVVRTGFVMGISLLLAAVVYFFAANWGGMDRFAKIGAAGGIVVLFYGLSYGFSQWKTRLGHQTFLSKIWLIGGCISFGATVALLHQIYNSHADSYELFLVWSIPALLLSWITRLHPLYLLSYILLHLTLWFFFFPTALGFNYSDGEAMLIGGLFALINLALLAVTELGWLRSKLLGAAGFAVFHLSVLVLTNSFAFERLGVWINIVSLAALALGFYYYSRIRLDKRMLSLNALAASAFAIFKFIELAMRHASTLFFIYGLVFVALLLAANVSFFRYMNKLGRRAGEEDGQPSGESADSNHAGGRIAGKLAATIVTVIGVMIGSVSLIGLVLMASDPLEPQDVLYALSLLLVTAVIFLPRMNSAVRYTVLAAGFAAGIVAIVWIDHAIPSLVLTALAVTGWIRLTGRALRLFMLAMVNACAAILLTQLFGSYEQALSATMLLLAALNAAILAGQVILQEGDGNGFRQHAIEGGLTFSLLFLFWLTFLEGLSPYAYELFNAVFFVASTAAVYVFIRSGRALESAISLVFWFAFIAFKYYDLLWTLLHKSITLALLGLAILGITYLFARKTATIDANGSQGGVGVIRRSAVWITVVLLLQLGYVGIYAVSSEQVLRDGTSIKLAIEPLDPRSLLQGDYMRLNYTISTLPDGIAKEMGAYVDRRKVKVVLAPDGQGVYQLDRIYKSGEALQESEIAVNGKLSGLSTVYYGIETYFVPEGTGLETEANARYAYIRVGADGDMLLERLDRE